MLKLIELFDCVWDFIEAAGAMGKRPEKPWGQQQAVKPVMSESRLEQFPVSRYFEPSLEVVEQSGFEQVSILLRQAADLLVWS